MKKDENLKIAYFGAKTYPPEIGGIETHVYNLIEEMKYRNNINFLVFVGHGEHKKKDYEKINNRIEVFRVKHSQNRYLLKITMFISVLIKLRKKRKDIDIFHAHDSVFGFFLSLLDYHPLVYTAHGCAFLRSDWPKPIKEALKFMESYIFKKADIIIAVDYNTQEVIEKISNREVVVIPNGVDPEAFENLERPMEYPKDKIIIFSSGRLIPSKGFQDLIDAYLTLDEGVKEKAELFIAGKGPMLEELKRKASVDSRIHILGYVPKIEPYFAHSDIFVLPSHYEGFPFTLLEAMAAKTACISTDVGDIPRRFNNSEDMIIVKPKNITQLSKELEKLVKDNNLRKELSRNAYKKIMKSYLWSKITDRVYELYTSLYRKH